MSGKSLKKSETAENLKDLWNTDWRAELTRVFMEEAGGKRMPKTWDLLDRLIKTAATKEGELL